MGIGGDLGIVRAQGVLPSMLSVACSRVVSHFLSFRLCVGTLPISSQHIGCSLLVAWGVVSRMCVLCVSILSGFDPGIFGGIVYFAPMFQSGCLHFLNVLVLMRMYFPVILCLLYVVCGC